MKRRLIAAALAGTLLLPALPSALAADQPSAWAADAVAWLQGTGKLTRANDFADFGRTVTRADFARLAVTLCELITGQSSPDVSAMTSPFTDTSDPDILRAYQLGVVNGTSATTFSPSDPVSREQIAVMLMRVLDACNVTYSKADVSSITFADGDQVSSWAVEGLKRAYLIQVINGTGNNNMSPKANATMETAYQLLYNVNKNLAAIRAGQVREGISSATTTPSTAQQGGQIGALSLKYSGGGKYSTGWCEEAYTSRPVLCDLDKDGKQEIISASYSIVSLDPATGSVNWRIPVGYDRSAPAGTQYVGRTWPDLYIGDVDGDGQNEIVAGHSAEANTKGSVAVYDCNGYFKPGWPVQLPAEAYCVEVADLDGDGTMEIIAGIGIGDGTSVYVYEHNGAIRTGWPQLSPAADGNKTKTQESNPKASSMAFSWGIFNDNIAVGDIDGDGQPEIVAPADMSQICAYNPDGSLVRTSEELGGGVVWGRVGAFPDTSYEYQVPNGGFGYKVNQNSPLSEREIATFTHSKAVIADMDGNGTNEIAVVGAVHDRAKDVLPSSYHELFLFNGDRTRYNDAWKTIPAAKDKPLSEDWSFIERCMPNPIAVDLDGDGKKEILYPDFSGKLNCYWLDHTQHGSWPINVYDGTVMEYATAPAPYDFNGDGKPELVFTTFTQKKNSSKKGSLVIADGQGNILQKVELPAGADPASATPNSCLSTPVIGDVDGDGKPEIILQTYLSGVTVYDVG